MTLVLEDKNKKIDDVVKQTTYNHKTYKILLRNDMKNFFLVVVLLNYEFGNTSGKNNRRGWFLILRGSNIVLKLLYYNYGLIICL
jgi:hypothetical protein